MNDTPEKTEKKLPPMPAREYEPVSIDPAIIRSPAMAIWFDQALFDRARVIAGYLSKAEGFVPPHLLGKMESCFAVVERSLSWKLSPFAVANACYQTPSGRVGFEGKLCQAAVENSGRLEGGIEFKHLGDWDKILGRFEIRTSSKSGKDYAVPTWTREQATELGLKVIVSGKLKGEAEVRTWELGLNQCFPLNSTLWATDPKSQICYTAVRRWANLAAPGLFMGVEFDREAGDDDSEMVRAARAKDITPPAPTREQFTKTAGPTAGADAPPAEGTKDGDGPPPKDPAPSDTSPEKVTTGTDSERNVTEGGTWLTLTSVPDGDTYDTSDAGEFVTMLLTMADTVRMNLDLLNGLWDSNSAQFQFLPDDLGQRIRDNWPRVKKPAKPKPPDNPNQDKLV